MPPGEILRHGDPVRPKRSWSRPVSGDIHEYVGRIKNWLVSETAGWQGQLNQSRQEHQNNHVGYNFADHWADCMREFAERSPAPIHILEVSVGPDAALLENHLNIFPQAQIWVIEENPANIEAAQAKLTENNYDLDRVHFREGNASVAQTYGRLPHFDIICANNLIQHIPVAPTQLQRLMGVTESPLRGLLGQLDLHLVPDGSLFVGDLAVTQWDINPAPGYENDPEVVKEVTRGKLYIHGNDKFPGAVKLGWPISRQATAFDDATHIAEVVRKYSSGRLRVVESPSTLEIKDMGPNDPAAIITAHIPATLAAGARAGLANAKKIGETAKQPQILNYLKESIPMMESAGEALTALGIVYLSTLEDKRFCGVFPTHYIQRFQKLQG